ncbi:MAG: M28 family peptidase [Phycisphaerales bacterium JB059]
MNHRRPLLRLAATCLSLAAPGAHAQPGASDALETTYFEHLSVLADPAMRGREPGDEGIERAARYIIDRFRALGLEPAFPTRTLTERGLAVLTPRAAFRQPMELRTNMRVVQSACHVGGQELTEGEDYTVLGHSGSGAFTGPLVFAGYSIAAGPRGYLGYPPAANMKGKAALILRWEPMDELGRSRWAEKGWSPHAVLTRKITAAVRRGASAVVITTPPGADDENAFTLDTTQNTPDTRDLFEVPVVMIRPEIARRLIEQSEETRSLEELRLLADEGEILIDLPGSEITLSVEVDRSPLTTDNLGAVLRGRGDLASEYIVISAHYDHIGEGRWASLAPDRAGEIHPGANDNASGVAGLLLAAQILSDQYAALPEDARARSVLFLPFTAEESGLDGSKHYVTRPIAPIPAHTILLNLEMIGRMRDGLMHILGVGSAKGLEPLIDRRLAESGLGVERLPGLAGGASDHASFDAVEVPYLTFHAGNHPEYHTPDDTIETINVPGAVRISTLMAAIAMDIATNPDGLDFSDPEPPDDRPRPQPTGPRVRTGIVPSARPDEGVVVSRVFDATSAADAGIEEGDVITEWNGTPTPDVQAWMPLLLEHEPGDEITVKIRRDDQEIELILILRAP